MRKIAAVLLVAAIFGFAPAAIAADAAPQAKLSIAPPADAWSVDAWIDRAGIDRAWIDRMVELVPAQLRDPPKMPEMPHLSMRDEDMRVMTISMGAMAGYMLAGMPFTVSVVVWAAVGGVAAQYWYDNYR
jgi:hypothetical protein